jgi:hypothetical protein
MRTISRIAVILAVTGSVALAGEADVVDVKAVRRQDRTYRFEVSVRHQDEGWEHYADRWDVVAPDGSLLGTRTLLHPHENEQPFTRSLDGVEIPANVERVTVRAHDKVHGYGGLTVEVNIPPD